jgi:inner membrane transporter RhtA
MALLDAPLPAPRVLSRVPSPALVIGGIASVQTGAAIATTLFHRIGPGGAVLLRLATASVILLLVSRPRLTGRTRREMRLAGLFGVVLAGMNLTFYHAIQRIPLGVAVTIEFVGPLAVAIIGSRRRLDLLWVLLAVLGILALLHGDTHSLDPIGVIEALAAGVLWGGYVLLSARLGRAFTDGSGLALSMCIATVLAAPVGVAEAGSGLFVPRALLLGAAVGVLSSAIPYSFEMEALRRIATHVFGVLMSLEPAMAALAGFIVVGQSLGARELAGIALVMVASLGASLRARLAPADA